MVFDDIHGGDIYRNRVKYDFSVSVNPLGMPKGSIQAAKDGILDASHYPDLRGEKLRCAIAEAEGVDFGEICLGNGASELIYALCRAVRAEKGLVPAPSFGEYEAALRASDSEICFWNLSEKEDFHLQEDFPAAVDASVGIVFLCNPNNPTGILTGRDQLISIAERCEETGTYLCVDECFLPFCDQEGTYTMKRELKRFPHLIVLRAFTKIYGMAGLRLGYAMSANEALTADILRVLPPWNTSLPAQMAGAAALSDREYIARTRRLIAAEKEYLTREMSDGLAERIYGGAANFLFFRSRADLKERLLKEEILIRSCSNYRNLNGAFFRIGIRTHEENVELIRRWREL